MAEEGLFTMQSLFTLIRVGLMMLLLIAFIWFFLAAVLEIRLKEVDRAAIEIANNMVQQPDGFALFNEQVLDNYDTSIEEPYSRHCRFAYFAEIESEDDEWSFGYESKIHNLRITFITSKSEKESPISILVGDEVVPATLKLTVVDTWLTRASCLAEKADLSGEVQTMSLPCVRRDVNECRFPLITKSVNGVNVICYVDGSYEECRHLDTVINDFDIAYRATNDKMATLVATPGSSGVQFSIINGV